MNERTSPLVTFLYLLIAFGTGILVANHIENAHYTGWYAPLIKGGIMLLYLILLSFLANWILVSYENRGGDME